MPGLTAKTGKANVNVKVLLPCKLFLLATIMSQGQHNSLRPVRPNVKKNPQEASKIEVFEGARAVYVFAPFHILLASFKSE